MRTTTNSERPAIHGSLRDPGFWAARLVTAAVAADDRLEQDFLAALQRDGLSKEAAENRLALIYELASLIETGAAVSDPALAQRLEVMAVDYYGDDDVQIGGGDLVRRSGDDGYWVQADVFVPNPDAPVDEAG